MAGVGAGGSEGRARNDRNPFDTLGPGDHVVVDDNDRGRGAGQDPAQVRVWQAIVERRERATQQPAGEQRRRQVGGVEAQIGDRLRLEPAEPGGGGTGAGQQLAIADRIMGGADRRPLGEGLGGHFQEQGRVHGATQSEDGSFLASLGCRSRPPTESEPSPDLLHRASSPVSSSR